MSEQKVQKKILEWLNANNYLAYKIVTANRAGVPDIIACSPIGQYVAIEVKYGSNTVSKLQDYVLREIKKRNGIAIVAYSLEDVIEAL
ncbi:hypothetical protein [Caudoviricetes sp.]|nr:hypothetical protein [Caudoviricetes sp.]